MSMDFDMDEILQLFLEESAEGLDVMESGLLSLDLGALDLEAINTIFRAAHSIKGGAATFGHKEVSQFTHGVETLLDEIRSGKRAITQDAVQLLLRSVDQLRGLLDATRNKRALDLGASALLQQEIASLLAEKTPAQQAASASPIAASAAAQQLPAQTAQQWHISFRPHATMLARRNDPLRILRELERLGSAKVVVDLSHLPSLEDLDPEVCYLAWQVELTTDAPRGSVEQVFDWVLDECDIAITGDSAATQPANSRVGAVSEPEPDTTSRPVVAQPVPSQAAVPAATRDANAVSAAHGDVAHPPATDDSPAREGAPAAGNAKAANRDGPSIRVSTEKVDTLLNLVGELVITQSMLRRYGDLESGGSINALRDGLVQLERHTRELQESVMQIRMLPISFCFSRFPRLVRDLSLTLGKKIELKMLGQQTELDKTVLEKIGDPLVHLVRNSLDHGIESPETRRQAGKPETGVITLSAAQEGGNVVIQVSDDGGGLNKDRILAKARERGLVSGDEELSDERIYALIFQPGFSTAQVVTDVSGRGVGMDVVRRNIKDLGGRIEIQSELGVGSTFTIRLPLTLAILDGQLIKVGTETFVVSLLSIVETVQVTADHIRSVPGRGAVYRMRHNYIPVLRLSDIFGIEARKDLGHPGLLVIVECDGKQLGLLVDELLGQQQVVIKSLEENYRQVDGIAGATILGDGSVALILNVPSIVNGFATAQAGAHSTRAA